MSREFRIYTDGSHFKGGEHDGRLGVGAILVDTGGSIIDSLSMSVDRSFLLERYRTSDVSNPTMEMYAVLAALKRFSSKLQFGDKIEILADYQGVRYWMTNKWRINKEYISMIKNDILAEAKLQRLELSFTWIKGHSTDVYNDLTDKLAKGEITKV